MEGMNFSFFVMHGIDLWLLVGEFQPTCSPCYDVSINHGGEWKRYVNLCPTEPDDGILLVANRAIRKRMVFVMFGICYCMACAKIAPARKFL